MLATSYKCITIIGLDVFINNVLNIKSNFKYNGSLE